MSQVALAEKSEWWRGAVIYEIAPISFQDTNGDGKGDLPGIESRMDYLSWLGVDAVWLTPFYPSPMLDFGYDISDYCAVDPIFGTLGDFDHLVQRLHARDIKVVLDFVPNHTSEKHPWFAESRSSRNSAKRDWYVWADPSTTGGPPNNWLSRFGGSAWQWDDSSGQYYYHSFLLEQPDLNWRNPQVRSAMADVLRFWMRRGVNGFRFDASAVLAEDALLRDDPESPDADENTPPPQRLMRVFSDDRPESLQYLKELRHVIDEFDDRLLCGEVQGKMDRIGHFYGSDNNRLMHLPLNFALLDSPWKAHSLQATIDAYYNAIPDHAFPDWVIGGHDKHRAASKVGQQQARCLAMLLLTLKGTAFFFAGDELAAEQASIPESAVQDPFEKLVPGYNLNRDPERVPMRWDTTKNGGFTTGEPWLPMGGTSKRSVCDMQKDKRSILHLYRELIRLRKTSPAFRSGDYAPLRSYNDIFAFERFTDAEKFRVALNLTHEARRVDCPDGDLVISTYLDGKDMAVQRSVLLRPDEGVIIKMR
ncbi:MAG: alpha-amylase family glycosyl hydrolase [Bradyrhizobium sp.]|jgi:alpha-glucosidase